MAVDDHSISWGDFEGVIAEGEKLQGGWSLRRIDVRRWLLLKRRDEHANSGDPVSERPESVVSGRTIRGMRGDMPPRGVARSGESRSSTSDAKKR